MRKPSHGWSARNHGGFKRSNKVKQIYKSVEKPADDLTIHQAAGNALSIHIRCIDPDCLHEKVEYAANIVTDFPAMADLTLAEIIPRSRCVACGKKGTAQMTFERPRLDGKRIGLAWGWFRLALNACGNDLLIGAAHPWVDSWEGADRRDH